MGGDAQRREHPVRGRSEFLRADGDVADTETRRDPERPVRQLRRGVGEAQCAQNQISGRLLLLRERRAYAQLSTRQELRRSR